MKNPFFLHYFVFLIIMTMAACDDSLDDAIPKSFAAILVNPDYIYVINSGDPNGVRLDPLLNDSIKVDVSVSYSTPTSGTISFIPNEGWFYRPDADFTGLDDITYTVCHLNECRSALITMVVEPPADLNNCTFEIKGESVETLKDQPISIRIFANDVVCPYQGSSLSSPEKGTFGTFSYSGSFKNIVYVYYPPKGFVGTDRFSYRLFSSDGDLSTFCTITVKEQ